MPTNVPLGLLVFIGLCILFPALMGALFLAFIGLVAAICGYVAWRFYLTLQAAQQAHDESGPVTVDSTATELDSTPPEKPKFVEILPPSGKEE
ncbi:MAG: hypothetical protein AB7G06_03110 [Bdellovibrionales bacterium]